MTGSQSDTCRAMTDVARALVAKLSDGDIRAAFVFGSVAWGDADVASDVDIAVCVDRPIDYREVTRVRVADVLGGSFPTGPRFADLDRISWERFRTAVEEGAWHQRVVRSVILTDVDGSYRRLRDQVSGEFFRPDSRRLRAHASRDTSRHHVEAALGSSEPDPTLRALHARLSLEHAAIALLHAAGERYSASHFLHDTHHALTSIDRGDLHRGLVVGLGLDCGADAADRGMRSYRAFADALGTWVAEPALANALRPEDRAWAAFSCADETYEEIDHKLATLARTGRTAEMVAYVDGLLKTPIRMNAGKVLNLRLHGTSEIPTIAEFHGFLRAEPTLSAHWADGLRLHCDPATLIETTTLTSSSRPRDPQTSTPSNPSSSARRAQRPSRTGGLASSPHSRTALSRWTRRR